MTLDCREKGGGGGKQGEKRSCLTPSETAGAEVQGNTATLFLPPIIGPFQKTACFLFIQVLYRNLRAI